MPYYMPTNCVEIIYIARQFISIILCSSTLVGGGGDKKLKKVQGWLRKTHKTVLEKKNRKNVTMSLPRKLDQPDEPIAGRDYHSLIITPVYHT